ncbi:MAG: DUF1624 domain-containing protein [Lachnospiraceae bacterium]|nr:DUF1624 domain-containing protein [Lachnospiraceae bacterium]
MTCHFGKTKIFSSERKDFLAGNLSDEKTTYQNSRPVKNRIPELDILRGITLFSMILFHGTWDLNYMYGKTMPWYQGMPGFFWQQSICWSFILLSGFCWQLGRHQFKRGLEVFLGGALVTAVTLIFMPENRVVFGILTCIGLSMLLLIPCHRTLQKIHPVVGAIGAFLLFVSTYSVNKGYLNLFFFQRMALPRNLYGNYFSTLLGFPFPGFYSTDYFSILPWFFLYLTGYFLYGIRTRYGNSFSTEKNAQKRESRQKLWIPFIFLGKHSLLIYLLHQPLLYFLMELIF